jgi:hypothetical protein
MATLSRAGNALRQGQSLLCPVFGGDYSSFVDQRELLRDVYEEYIRQNAIILD